MSDAIARQPHAVLDLTSRRFKAQKIERLLGLDRRSAGRPLRLLEIGAGSGGISHYFGTHPDASYTVDAVDVVDNRLVKDGYSYTQVSDTSLPFASGTFDVVLSNHVFEHVGDDAAQRHHLLELRRVMRSDGIGYLAVPNRWMLVEPHYRLAFLSWLPEKRRSAWLRFWRKGTVYDCRPPSRGHIERALQAADFDFEQLHAEALRMTFELERPNAAIYRMFLRPLPNRLYAMARGLFPTLIYRLRGRAR